MKRIIGIFVFFTFLGCSKKVAPEFSRFNGYYYMHSSLLKFQDYGLNDGLDYQYIIFDQASSKISAINCRTNKILDFPIEENGANGFTVELRKKLYFTLEEDKRPDKVFVSINFYNLPKSENGKLVTYGYREEDIKSISDMQKRIAERKKENEIFEENLPPGQE
ncbi:MAG: hypothetical protein O9301_14835 [Leptospira sp.]|nr:hypothetical protein [Leptospira sp.]